MPPPDQLNPLADFKATFDLFYQFVRSNIGNLGTEQRISLQPIAKPLDVLEADRWFFYGQFADQVDRVLDPGPVQGQGDDTVTRSVTAFSKEFQSFVNNAQQLVDRRSLDNETRDKIAAKLNDIKALQSRIQKIDDDDREAYRKYAETNGIELKDKVARVQWMLTRGSATEKNALTQEIRKISGDLAILRNQVYKDPDEKEIADAYDANYSAASLMKYPTEPDSELGGPFTAADLANLAGGFSTSLFTERPVILPNAKLRDIKTSNAGQFSVEISKESTDNTLSKQDWGGGGSVGYLWFYISADTNESRKIQDDFSTTTKIELSCKSLIAVDYIASAWFFQNLFKNNLIKKNIRAFERYFGKNGSLLYYPASLVLMRGFSVTFTKTNDWTYNYDSFTSRNGGGGISIFGINFGGSAGGRSEFHKHQVTHDREKLTFSDGEDTVRVVGYVTQKNAELNSLIMQPMTETLKAAAAAMGHV